MACGSVRCGQAHDVDTVYVVGIATDFCVSWTATDAVDLGYTSHVILNATAPISLPAGDAGTTVDVAYAEWAAKGVTVKTVDEVLAMACPAPPPAPDATDLALTHIGGPLLALLVGCVVIGVVKAIQTCVAPKEAPKDAAATDVAVEVTTAGSTA